MKKIFDKEIVARYVENSKYKDLLKELAVKMFLVQYEDGEFISSPSQDELLFQIVADGSLTIYFIRDDGSRYSLASGTTNYIINDMDLFKQRNNSIYAEASGSLTCIAFDIDKNRDLLLNSADFLRLVANSLSTKIGMLTELDAAPTSLTERVLSYMKYKCDSGILKGIEQAAFHIHCSSRQLQRILNNYEKEGIIKKIGKGTYMLLPKK